jgi:hypothetical protein
LHIISIFTWNGYVYWRNTHNLLRNHNLLYHELKNGGLTTSYSLFYNASCYKLFSKVEVEDTLWSQYWISR